MKFNSQCIPDPRSIFGFAIRSKWRAKCAVNRNKHRHIYIYIYTIYVAFRPFLSVECLCVCDKNSVYVSRSPLFTQCLAPLLRKTPAHFPVNPRKRTKCSSFAWFPNMQFMFFRGTLASNRFKRSTCIREWVGGDENLRPWLVAVWQRLLKYTWCLHK